MKVIALYLPQFHRTAENDAWWGEGYTEWTAVKAGEPYFEDHYQPHIPLNGNYYDLLDKEVMQWQAGLMKKYDVHGMCFYHYYFGAGRKVLEKPAENLLEWKDIDMPFCFSWANETWARSWSKISQKVEWNALQEPEKDSADNDGILIRQEYGSEKEWRDHFDYLLPFFKDERYIKLNGQPVFIIYKPKEIDRLACMKEKWDEWAKEQGFEGIYLIGCGPDHGGLDARLQQEPKHSNFFALNIRGEYSDICDQIVTNAVLAEGKCYLCGTTGYDDTPRHGLMGSVLNHSTPELFYGQMKILMYLSKKKGNEFIFVNAWNEWGEGMHLEPDERYRYRYLEAVKDALRDFGTFGESDVQGLDRIVERGSRVQIQSYRRSYAKAEFICDILERLLRLAENGQSIGDLLAKDGYEKVAVYGLGRIGKHLIAALKGSDIQIAYGIDQNAQGSQFAFPVYTIADILPQTDLIVVTIDDGTIRKDLCSRYDYPVAMIKDLLEEHASWRAAE